MDTLDTVASTILTNIVGLLCGMTLTLAPAARIDDLEEVSPVLVGFAFRQRVTELYETIVFPHSKLIFSYR